MATQAEQRLYNTDQNTGTQPTNTQAGGPGTYGNEQTQNQGQFDNNNNRFDDRNANTQGGGLTGQQQQQGPPSQQTGQNSQFNQGTGPGQHDQYANQNKGVTGGGHHAGGPARAAEAGAAYEGEKLAHGGHAPGANGTQYQSGAGTGQGQHGQHDQYANQNTGVAGGNHHAGGPVRAAEGGAVYEGEKLAHGGRAPGANETQYQSGTGTGPGQHDQYANQNTGVTGGGHHTGGPVRAAEAGAAYEGEKLAHGGRAPGANGAQHHPGAGTGTGQHDQFANQSTSVTGGQRHAGGPTRAAEAGAVYEGEKLVHGGRAPGANGTQYQSDAGTGTGQHDQFSNQNTGVTGGHHHPGGPARAAEAGAAYEGGKIAHETHGTGHHGDHFTGRHDGQGANAANANAPGYGAGPTTGMTRVGGAAQHPSGQAGLGGGPGATTGTVGAPGTGYGVGQGGAPGSGAYTGQGTAGTTGTGTGVPGTHAGAPTGTAPAPARGGTGQAQVILGKLQQAGGAILSDDAMKAKGLEREAKGVAKVDQQEAGRLEGKAAARREKASGIHGGGAAAGVDPTVGPHGRNL
ncbi:uncharacterized protein FOMMEDRAFT_170627 [Fomitiporia mediterranea MF3/22]|uniref:uncharacterized protein n=1 Tax=Fomitiporia mediterranea (strain MF3/22) TaxID=694068 RepID=UPI0004409134|nr:uncharacterized protein FOMMEDRAFT_170627 [Fomitiporia mediterranea MF3/22]EJC99337.1 hypothetical protein FOMMEDRAFT_170627 [Fomitiporia mediterranea MF3/22]